MCKSPQRILCFIPLRSCQNELETIYVLHLSLLQHHLSSKTSYQTCILLTWQRMLLCNHRPRLRVWHDYNETFMQTAPKTAGNVHLDIWLDPRLGIKQPSLQPHVFQQTLPPDLPAFCGWYHDIPKLETWWSFGLLSPSLLGSKQVLLTCFSQDFLQSTAAFFFSLQSPV